MIHKTRRMLHINLYRGREHNYRHYFNSLMEFYHLVINDNFVTYRETLGIELPEQFKERVARYFISAVQSIKS